MQLYAFYKCSYYDYFFASLYCIVAACRFVSVYAFNWCLTLIMYFNAYSYPNIRIIWSNWAMKADNETTTKINNVTNCLLACFYSIYFVFHIYYASAWIFPEQNPKFRLNEYEWAEHAPPLSCVQRSHKINQLAWRTKDFFFSMYKCIKIPLNCSFRIGMCEESKCINGFSLLSTNHYYFLSAMWQCHLRVKMLGFDKISLKMCMMNFYIAFACVWEIRLLVLHGKRKKTRIMLALYMHSLAEVCQRVSVYTTVYVLCFIVCVYYVCVAFACAVVSMRIIDSNVLQKNTWLYFCHCV